MCWYCYWGWSKPVKEIYNKYAEIAGESAMHYGPAHIVWEDENFEREHVQSCLDHTEWWADAMTDYSIEELLAVKQSLLALLMLPDEILAPAPSAYYDSNEDPSKFPPTVEMVK